MDTFKLDFGEVSQEAFTAMYIVLQAFLLDTKLDVEELTDSIVPSDAQDLEDIQIVRTEVQAFLDKMEKDMSPLILIQLKAALAGIVIA